MTIPFRPGWYFFIALVSITFIGPLSLYLFIPAMSAVKQGFGVSTGMAQLTMSLAMLSMDVRFHLVQQRKDCVSLRAMKVKERLGSSCSGSSNPAEIRQLRDTHG